MNLKQSCSHPVKALCTKESCEWLYVLAIVNKYIWYRPAGLPPPPSMVMVPGGVVFVYGLYNVLNWKETHGKPKHMESGRKVLEIFFDFWKDLFLLETSPSETLRRSVKISEGWITEENRGSQKSFHVDWNGREQNGTNVNADVAPQTHVHASFFFKDNLYIFFVCQHGATYSHERVQWTGRATSHSDQLIICKALGPMPRTFT